MDDLTVKLATAAFVGLASVITALWRWSIAGQKKIEHSLKESRDETATKLAACEEHHSKTQEQLLDLSVAVGRLEGEKRGVEALSAKVLAEVREASKGGDSE